MINYVVLGSLNEDYTDYLEDAISQSPRFENSEQKQYDPSSSEFALVVRQKIEDPAYSEFWIEEPFATDFLEKAVKDGLDTPHADKIILFSGEEEFVSKLNSIHNAGLNLGTINIEQEVGESSQISKNEVPSEEDMDEVKITDMDILFGDVDDSDEYNERYDNYERQIVQNTDSNSQDSQKLLLLVLEKDETIKSYQSQLEERNKELESLRTINITDAQTEGFEEELDNLAKQLSETKEERNRFEKEMVSLQTQLNSLKNSTVSQSEFDSKIAEIELLIAERDKIKIEYQEQIRQNNSLQIKLDSMSREIDEKDILLRERTRKLDNVQSDNKNLSDKIKALESQPDFSQEVLILKEQLAKKDILVDSLNSDVEKQRKRIDSMTDEKVKANAELERLKFESNEHQKTIAMMQKELIKNNNAHSSSAISSSIDVPISLSEVVWDGIFKTQTRERFKNVEFLFAGSSDSIRDAYIIGKKKLKNGGIFVDLSSESQADYRFGLKKTGNSSSWLTEPNTDFKQFLSKTNTQNVYCLVLAQQSYNDLYLKEEHHLLDRLRELDRFNQKIIVFGGVISSYIPRALMVNALQTGNTTVVSKATGTSARAMFYNSLMVGQSNQARYLIVGKLDKMSSQVAKAAKKKGYTWEVFGDG